MSFENRDYYRDSNDGGGRLGRMATGSVTMWLLCILLGIFILDGILSTARFLPEAIAPWRWGVFSVEDGIFGFQVWRFFTYQFFHAGFFHLLMNGIGLYFFGPMMEAWWGKRRFLAFYLLCGASGALLFVALSFIPGFLGVGPETILLGASGSVFGILAGCATLFPHQRVMLLIPPVPMSMRTMALLFLGIAALSLIVGANNAGGEAAHLGGALLGFLLVKNPKVLNWADRQSHSVGLKRRFETMKAERDEAAERQREAQVDAILDKVREHGLPSLTAKEKKILNQETKRQNKAG